MSENKQLPLKILKAVDQQKALLDWYEWLHEENHRGERAQLGRAGSLDAVIMQKGFLNLARRLPEFERHLLEGIALVAGILAWIEQENDKPLPKLLGKNKEGSDMPLFSELRFQRLLASDTPDAFYQNLRRAVIQVGKTANPLLLADSILHWEQERRHPDWQKFQGPGRWQYQQARAYYIQN